MVIVIYRRNDDGISKVLTITDDSHEGDESVWEWINERFLSQDVKLEDLPYKLHGSRMWAVEEGKDYGVADAAQRVAEYSA